jgi:glycosyltransferase involved in cell wall biosynthesis
MERSKLRLLYYVESLGLGGANQTTLTVAAEMKKRGHDVFFASEEGPLAAKLADAGIPHIRIKTKVRHPSPRASWILFRAIQEHDIDLFCPNGFDCTMDAIPAALLAGKPVLPTWGGLLTPPFPHPWLPNVNIFSMELAADLRRRFGWSHGTIHNLIARIDGKQFNPRIDGQPFRKELGVDPHQPLVLMVCRQDTTKLQGVLTLLDAATGIRSAIPKVRIALMGDGDRRDRILARIREIHDEVGEQFVLAPGSTPDAPAAFSAADLVVANGARSALEAMACGKPVVSAGPNGFCGALSPTTIEGFRRYNFDKGRLAGNPLGSRENLVQAARRILGDDELRRSLGEFSLSYAEEHLLIQSAASKYEDMYRQAVADPWAGRWSMLRAASDYMVVLVKYYAYLYRRRVRRRAGEDTSVDFDELLAPTQGLDPEWLMGLPDEVES